MVFMKQINRHERYHGINVVLFTLLCIVSFKIRTGTRLVYARNQFPEVGTQYFKSTDDIGTGYFAKKVTTVPITVQFKKSNDDNGTQYRFSVLFIKKMFHDFKLIFRQLLSEYVLKLLLLI